MLKTVALCRSGCVGTLFLEAVSVSRRRNSVGITVDYVVGSPKKCRTKLCNQLTRSVMQITFRHTNWLLEFKVKALVGGALLVNQNIRDRKH